MLENKVFVIAIGIFTLVLCLSMTILAGAHHSAVAAVIFGAITFMLFYNLIREWYGFSDYKNTKESVDPKVGKGRGGPASP